MITTPPKFTRLFQYRPSAKWAVDNLSRGVLWFGSPKRFNDPFDCRVPLLTEEEMRRFPEDFPEMKMTGEQFNDRIRKFFQSDGFACFSRKNDSLLMWSHYSSQGRGFCLEFEIPDDFLPLPVCYKNKRPSFDYAFRLRKKRLKNPMELMNFMWTKSKDWAYEEEERIWESKTGEVSYPREMLKAVYFGAKTTPRRVKQIRAIIEEKYPKGTKLYRAFLHPKEYKILFEDLR